MDIATSVRTCLTEKYATFAGRASRSEYWWFFLAYVIGALVVGLAVGVTGLGFLQWLYVLALIVPLLAVGFRRMQDIGKPGWYVLIPGALSLVTLLFAPSTMEIGADGMPTAMPSFGSTLFFGILGLIQLVVTILFLWWLTRPSQPETNAYGPPPQP